MINFGRHGTRDGDRERGTRIETQGMDDMEQRMEMGDGWNQSWDGNVILTTLYLYMDILIFLNASF